jgi:hypothetical protein
MVLSIAMKEIRLTKGFVAVVDDADYEELTKFSWYAKETKWGTYAERSFPRKPGVRRTNITMHRQLLGLKSGDGKYADHVDGNTLDNRRSNLRVCTNAQNAANVGPRKGKRFKGVDWYEPSCKWRAYIRVNYKRSYLGLYDTPEEAAKAYDSAALAAWGEFAQLNFPMNDPRAVAYLPGAGFPFPRNTQPRPVPKIPTVWRIEVSEKRPLMSGKRVPCGLCEGTGMEVNDRYDRGRRVIILTSWACPRCWGEKTVLSSAPLAVEAAS